MSKKSYFIDILAWIFIIAGAIAAFVAVFQAVMFSMAFNVFGPDTQSTELPEFIRFLLKYVVFLIYLFILFCTVTVISAIGLLQRKNWARYVFLVIIGLGIVWLIASQITQFMMFEDMAAASTTNPTDEVGRSVSDMQLIMGTFNTLLVIMFGWIMIKLNSKKIRAEFTKAPEPDKALQ